MFAVINTGGKQYKVKRDSVIKVEKLEGAAGSKIEFKDILMIGENSKPSFIGTPIVKGAKVIGEIMGQFRDAKVIVFKKKRRHNYRRKNGHRQNLTEVKIVDVSKE
jgi:large subunit ribosomal protein L21